MSDSPHSLSHSSAGKIAFLFGLGHGHYAQFLNFRECFPPEAADRAEWIGLAYDSSPDWLANFALAPRGLRMRRHQLWHARAGLARHADWDALFVAGHQLGYLPLMRRFPTYLYVDYSPSIVRGFAPYFGVPLNQSRLREAAKLVTHRLLFHASRGVFSMSEWAAHGVVRDYRLPPSRIHISPPGANLKRWHMIDRHGRPAERPVRILMVGGEFERKGGHQLLRWAEETRVRGWELDIVTWPGELPDWVAEMLGHPAPDDRISRSLAPRLPQVRVHCGVKANTPEIMLMFRDADVFCLPTLADASPIAALEAMATGLPVVVGAVGGVPELISHGETGFLVRPRDAGDLAAALEQLIREPSRRLRVGDAARFACERFFNVERQVRGILEVIDADTARMRTTRR